MKAVDVISLQKKLAGDGERCSTRASRACTTGATRSSPAPRRFRAWSCSSTTSCRSAARRWSSSPAAKRDSPSGRIPGGIDVPGAELAWRARELAPDPDTLIVVNCAGRTRSIIGCQSPRNAGMPNRVVALKDGTMGWELAGFQAERGATRTAPLPSKESREWSKAAAHRVARRFPVRFVEPGTVKRWQRDGTRTLYPFDVRTREEFEAGHIVGSRHAPGGQLVQASSSTQERSGIETLGERAGTAGRGARFLDPPALPSAP